MSAYICSDAHISALAGAFVCWTNPHGEYHRTVAEQIARMLHRENVRSVNARYRERKRPKFRFDPDWAEYNFHPFELMRAAQRYAYQACEHKGWDRSQARLVVLECVACAAAKLPGYWDASDPFG